MEFENCLVLQETMLSFVFHADVFQDETLFSSNR